MFRKKTTLLQVRCSPEEKAEWEAKAKAQGVTVSELVRATFSGDPIRSQPIAPRRRDYTPIDPNLLRQIAGIGNNLNQLARWANKLGGIVGVEVIANLIGLEQSVKKLTAEVRGDNHVDEGF